ncbi:calcium-gated potassium channel MthK [Aquimarina addita]|uniref:Calcium-gated potassium channel MthK n=1 Tax=Aquimarina addita TaxID=870485 RepID=A0ABP7XG04_9FLAO
MKKRVFIVIIFSIISYNLSVYLLYIFESTSADGNILNLRDSYWYSIVTLTTVGYGDFYPVTFWGRTIGFLFILGSLGILGLLISELSLIISNYRQKKKEGYFGTTMEKHCVIIGWDDFSQMVAEQIINANKELAIITDDKEDIDRINSKFPQDHCFAYLSNLKSYSKFEKVNIDKAERVYLNFKDDSETLVYTINLKKAYPNATFVVALNNMELVSTFNYMGVNFVISKNEIASKLIASYVFEPNVALFAEDLLSTSEGEDELDIWEKEVPEDSLLIGQNYIDVFVDLKKKLNIILLGVCRDGVQYKNPDNLSIEYNDILVFIGGSSSYADLNEFLY